MILEMAVSIQQSAAELPESPGAKKPNKTGKASYHKVIITAGNRGGMFFIVAPPPAALRPAAALSCV